MIKTIEMKVGGADELQLQQPRHTMRDKKKLNAATHSLPHPSCSCGRTLGQSREARNQVGIGLSYGPAKLHRLMGRFDNSVPTRFLYGFKAA